MYSKWAELTEIGNEHLLESQLETKGLPYLWHRVSPLIPAIQNRNATAVRILLEHGARGGRNYAFTGVKGETSLLNLVFYHTESDEEKKNQERMANMLLDAGADPKIRNSWGYSTFENSLIHGSEKLIHRIQTLFEDEEDEFGRNRLVQFIIGNPTFGHLPNAGFQEPDNFGWTASDYAKLHGYSISTEMPSPEMEHTHLFKGSPILAISLRNWWERNSYYNQILYNYKKPGAYFQVSQKGQRSISPRKYKSKPMEKEELNHLISLLQLMGDWKPADGKLPTDFDTPYRHYNYVMTAPAREGDEPQVYAFFFEYLEPMSADIIKRSPDLVQKHYLASRVWDQLIEMLEK